MADRTTRRFVGNRGARFVGGLSSVGRVRHQDGRSILAAEGNASKSASVRSMQQQLAQPVVSRLGTHLEHCTVW